MPENFFVTLVQYNINWNKRKSNLKYLETIFKDFSGKTDLIILPELFHCGFISNPDDVKIFYDHSIISWLEKSVKEYNFSIICSYLAEERKKYYNRFILITPDGIIQKYDKRHLFTIENENECLERGISRELINYKNWKIFPEICYDIRFPVWSRNNIGYDILINVANWPNDRIPAWEILLRARALENQCYVIGVNRVGTDKYRTKYGGNSMIISPDGKILKKLSKNREETCSYLITYDHLENLRRNFPILNDMDSFQIFI